MSNRSITPSASLTLSDLVSQTKIRSRFDEVLGQRAPQFISSMIGVASAPHLREADPKSILAAAMVAATLDLPIDRNLGFAHIVPYKTGDRTLAQFQMGYKGFIQLALRTGQYRTINDAVIPGGVLVSYNELTGDLELDWSKADESKEPDGYAFFFRLNNGFEKTIFWTRDKVLRHAKRFSKSFNRPGSPWKDHFDPMALKTVIKAGLSKYGILSIELRTAVLHDQGTQADLTAEITYLDSDEPKPLPSKSEPEQTGPDFSDSSQPTGEETQQEPPAENTPAPSEHVATDVWDELRIALSDIGVKQTDFVDGLRLIDPQRVPRQAKIVADLRDDVIKTVLEEGLDSTLSLIEAKLKRSIRG